MKELSRVPGCAAGILMTLACIGCGGVSFTSPTTSVSATSNPLVAQYTIQHFREGLSAWVEFGPDTSYGRITSTMTNSVKGPYGQALNILVAGMTPQTTYHMRAHVTWTGGSWVDQDQTFITGTLPTTLTSPQFARATTPSAASIAPAPGIELLSLVAGQNMLQAAATDLQGNLIWYCPVSAAVPIKQLPNGHFIVNLYTHLWEIDLACNVVRDLPLTQVSQSLQSQGDSFDLLNFSHDVLVLPNGHWITIIQVSQNFTDLPGYPGTTAVLGDIVVDIDTNGNVVWNWSAFNYLDVNRALFGLPDWTHSNALVYTQDGNLLLSMRNQSWIIKIDYSNGTGSGNVLWKLGEGGDFSLAGGDPSQWFYGQHYPDILSVSGSQTTLAIYDDGNFRIDSAGVACSSSASAPACYSRAAIFQIDESTNMANVLWQYLPGYYSYWGGSIDVLSNGDVEFDSSSPFSITSSLITEVTQTDTPQIVWQLSVNGANAYRGYRIPSLYPGVTWLQ